MRIRECRFLGVAAIVALALFGGCKSHEVVPSSGTRLPTNPEIVKIHQTFPRRYESLGIVTLPITPEVRWDERGESIVGIDRLKVSAAKLGANGLLLELPQGTYDVKTTVGYKGTFYQFPAKYNPKTVVAEAIYVLEQ